MVVQAHPKQAPGPTLERPVLRPVEAKRRPTTLHLLTYIVGNALAWILWGAITIATDTWYWWPVVPLAGWTLVLALHLWHVYGADMGARMTRESPTNSAAKSSDGGHRTSNARRRRTDD
jgi:hypothetical protein